jgi:hypothetical protein
MPPSVAAESAVLELLRELLAGQREIIARLSTVSDRQQVPPSSLSRDDRKLLMRLLPAIGGALGSEVFTSRDLACHAAPRLVLRGRSAKSIGKLLARADGRPIEGWIVERVGSEINVALWRVVASVSHRCESGTGLAPSDSIGRGEPDA